MPHIAVLGTGTVGSTLAPALAAAGHQITIGTRNPAARPDWLTHGLALAAPSDAASSADIVINATPGNISVQHLGALRQELAGKVLVDVANAYPPAVLEPPNISLAERLQQDLPEAKVVKTLNTVLAPVMADPNLLSTPATVFVSGDDPGARKTVTELLNDLGWSAILDLGTLRTARGPEAAALLVPDLFAARGFVPLAISLVT